MFRQIILAEVLHALLTTLRQPDDIIGNFDQMGGTQAAQNAGHLLLGPEEMLVQVIGLQLHCKVLYSIQSYDKLIQVLPPCLSILVLHPSQSHGIKAERHFQ